MVETSLLVTSATAFGAVFVLLLLLALVIQLITVFFPERPAIPERPDGRCDAAVVSAISVTVSSLFPGAQVTRIEELS